ncbi:gamma-glutamylcyclotransferase ['Osedax' symbiont bacterium Rs2_46_30_T18]|nr:gamma-glutamylcyclotransferase ['Osedax' symbiont bacterium Rs2_46_30_T18]
MHHNKNKSARHFIFGYGSLINSISRTVTGETGAAVAVKVKGFDRHWSRISTAYGMSSVVVVANPLGACNGVLVEIDEAELSNFDIREGGYQRVLVDSSQVEFYQQSLDLSAARSEIKIWLYQADKVVDPCSSYPIAFSYLDVILSGCLEYSQEFCSDFVQLTKGWQHETLNDRLAPRYPRVQSDLNTQLLNGYIKPNSKLQQHHISVGYDRKH